MTRVVSLDQLNQPEGIKETGRQRSHNFMNKSSSQKRLEPIQKRVGGMLSAAQSAVDLGQKKLEIPRKIPVGRNKNNLSRTLVVTKGSKIRMTD